MQQPSHVPVDKLHTKLFVHVFLNEFGRPKTLGKTKRGGFLQQVLLEFFELLDRQFFWSPRTLFVSDDGNAVIFDTSQPVTYRVKRFANGSCNFFQSFSLSTQ